MRAYPFPLSPSSSSSSVAVAFASLPPRFSYPISKKTFCSFFPSSTKLLVPQFRPNSRFCSNSEIDATQLGPDDKDYFDDDGGYYLPDEGTEYLDGDGVSIKVKKLGGNSRSIRSKIGLDASLDTVWNLLTDYEKLADFIPGLAVSKLVEKKDNYARLYQIGQQNLPLGLKFNAKAVLDCYEKDLEIFPSGRKREIEFKMVEGDFQCFEGKWSIEQFNKAKCEDLEASLGQEFQTTLSYLVDVKPKRWLPVRLIEGRICREIKMNLSSIREEAKKVIDALRDL